MTNSISSLLWISIVIPNFRSHNIIISARVYCMKRVKDCKDESGVYYVSTRWTVITDKFTLFVYCNFHVLLSTTVCSQNINKLWTLQTKLLTDNSFLSRYFYTKSKNYFKRRYRIRHWIPRFFGTPCILYRWLQRLRGLRCESGMFLFFIWTSSLKLSTTVSFRTNLCPNLMNLSRVLNPPKTSVNWAPA